MNRNKSLESISQLSNRLFTNGMGNWRTVSYIELLLIDLLVDSRN